MLPDITKLWALLVPYESVVTLDPTPGVPEMVLLPLHTMPAFAVNTPALVVVLLLVSSPGVRVFVAVPPVVT